jgi:hypothetical protein
MAVIEADLLPARADAQAGFAWSRGHVVRRWRHLLHAERDARIRCPRTGRRHWDGTTPLLLPTGGSAVPARRPSGSTHRCGCMRAAAANASPCRDVAIRMR